MNAVRKAVPALQKGTWSWAGNPSSGSGVGYTRTCNGQVVAVGLAKDSTVNFSFTGLPPGTYRDAVTGTAGTDFTPRRARISMSCPGVTLYIPRGHNRKKDWKKI